MAKKTNRELAKEIADAVIVDLSGRKGILDDVDYDVLSEMQDDLDSLVFEKLESNLGE
jgi:hypothetical protein